MPRKTVCITGGAGFIGSHLADALVAEGHRVLVIDDLSGGTRANLGEGVELHPIDIRSPQAAELVAGGGIEILFHLAAQMDVRRSVADPVFDADVNVVGSLKLLEAARRGQVRQIIFASTGGAIYGEQGCFPAGEDHPAHPLSPYGVSKLAVERYLYFYQQAYGMDATCLRYANVYGERQNPHGEAGVVAIFLKLLLSGSQPTINGDGLQTRDYIHVGDVVAANLAAMDQPGFRIYNIGTGIETSVVDLYQAIMDAAEVEMPAKFGPGKPGEQRRSSIDARLAHKELALAEPRPLPQGLRQTAAWFADQSGP